MLYHMPKCKYIDVARKLFLELVEVAKDDIMAHSSANIDNIWICVQSQWLELRESALGFVKMNQFHSQHQAPLWMILDAIEVKLQSHGK